MTNTDNPQTFTDTRGRSLTRSQVEFLATRNMAGSSPAGIIHNDYELLEWATDVNGEFVARQVKHYGFTFLPAGTKGVKLSDL